MLCDFDTLVFALKGILNERDEYQMKKGQIFKGFIYTGMALAVICSTLTGCGGEFNTGAQQNSTSVVSGRGVEVTKTPQKISLELDISNSNKITIPDPAKIQGGVVKIKLQEELKEDDFEYNKDELSKRYMADLSFAGFENEVTISSYTTGNMTDPDSPEADCLALFVHENPGTENSKNYFVVLDYNNGTFYKTDTNFFLHHFSSWTDLKAVDVTGDGKQELMASHIYNKSVEIGIFRCEEKDHRLVNLFSTLDDPEQEDCSGFIGTLKEDYQVVLEFPKIHYSKKVSMIHDGNFKEKDLQADSDDNMAGFWKNGKLQKDRVETAQEDDAAVFLYTLDHAEFTTEKSSDATLLELVRGICVGHRSEQLGNMHMFLQYDRKSDRMVLKKAKYVNTKEARKEWNEWDEWKEALE